MIDFKTTIFYAWWINEKEKKKERTKAFVFFFKDLFYLLACVIITTLFPLFSWVVYTIIETLVYSFFLYVKINVKWETTIIKVPDWVNSNGFCQHRTDNSCNSKTISTFIDYWRGRRRQQLVWKIIRYWILSTLDLKRLFSSTSTSSSTVSSCSDKIVIIIIIIE